MAFPAHCEFETRPTSHTREWRSRNRRHVVRISESLWAELEQRCAGAGGLETGGVLVGRYEDDNRVARVLGFSTPTPDSRRGPADLWRGTAGLSGWLRELWGKDAYYLGEWHLHPSASPAPSATDIHSLLAIARDPAYQCASPLMLILGGRAPSWRHTLWVCERERVLPLDEEPPVEEG